MKLRPANPLRRLRKRREGEAEPEENGDAAAATAPVAPRKEPRTPDAPAGSEDRGGGGEVVAATTIRNQGEALLEALERHVPGAREHADATATYSFALAVELGGNRSYCEVLREIARLHEVGKIYVRSELAGTPRDELLPNERTELDNHHEQGAALLAGAGLGSEVGELVLAIRERFDGRGPKGMAGRAIPLGSRIIRVACAFHEGTKSRRAGRWRGETRELGLARVRAEAGAELDPEVVSALTRVVAHVQGAESS